MTKKEFIQAMAAKTGLNQKQSSASYDAFLSTIEEELHKGEKVSFLGFGTFHVVKKDAHTARNPKTGNEIKVPAKRVVKFKVGASLKDLKK